MNNRVSISVIVPVYQAEKYLNRCVASILNQTFSDFELILIEDGSPDNCAQLCDSLALKDTRIKVIHKENGGASSARNAGLDVATGEYIAFIDSDDWIEPMMFERLSKLVREHDAEMAICEMRVVKENAPNIKNSDPKVEIWNRKELLDFFFRVHGENLTYTSCRRLISKHLLEGYRFIEGKMNEDIETSYYLSTMCKKAVYTNEVFYNYFKNYEGVTNSRFSRKKLDLLYIWDIIAERVLELTPEYKKACDMNYKRARFTLLTQMYLNGYDYKDDVLNDVKRQLKKEVRASYWDLMRWKMPPSRKMLLTVLCII